MCSCSTHSSAAVMSRATSSEGQFSADSSQALPLAGGGGGMEEKLTINSVKVFVNFLEAGGC